MTFFEQALEVLVAKYGVALDSLTIVLPDQNALPAFRDAAGRYAASARKPVLLPSLKTLHGFCLELSGMRIPRRLTLLSTLHQVISTLDGPLFSQTFEKAKPRLEMLLSDFDELDSQLVDAELLFKSLKEESEITLRFSDYMTEEDEAVIRAYWQHFKASRIEQNDRLQMELFAKLPVVYKAFRKELNDRGRAYRGAMYRNAYERLVKGEEVGAGEVAFVGFNKLTEAQLRIMEYYANEGRGTILWDELIPEGQTDESTFFHRKYASRRAMKAVNAPLIRLQQTNALSNHTSFYGAGRLLGAEALVAEVERAMAASPASRAVVISADGSLAGLMTELLVAKGLAVQNLHRQTLASTPLYHLLSEVFTLQGRLEVRGEHIPTPFVWLLPILGHPIVKNLYEKEIERFEALVREKKTVLIPHEVACRLPIIEALCQQHGSPAELWRDILLSLLKRAKGINEDLASAIQHILHILHALEEQVGEGTLQDAWNYWSILSGEMGASFLPVDESDGPVVLASLSDIQGQDFDLVFFSDANEGLLPAQLPRNSLIPLPFRAVTGMTTPKDDAAQQAYLFFRLLKRAKKVFYYVNESTSELSHAEPSHYLSQLRDIGGLPIQKTTLRTDAQAHPPLPITIEKTEAVMLKLRQYYYTGQTEGKVQRLYPTQLATYLKCPLLFYLSVLTGLRDLEGVTEDIDGSRFGNVLHDSMEALYHPLYLTNRPVQEADLDTLAGQVSVAVRAKLMAEYGFTAPSQIADLGYVSISEEVLVEIVRKLVERDRARLPFTISKLETRLDTPYAFTIQIKGEPVRISLDGKFDRADWIQRNGHVLEVVDFKTGGKVELDVPDWDALFAPSGAKDYKEAFQIILYAWLLHKAEAANIVKPTVIRIADLFEEGKPTTQTFTIAKQAIESVGASVEEIETRLKSLLEEIFDPGQPFKQTTDQNACRYCSFAGLCHKA